MKYCNLILITFIVITFFHCGSKEQPGKETKSNVIFAGVRSSSYGIRPFPDPEKWASMMNTMAEYFPGSASCGIWIVGVMHGPDSCHLSFPSDGETYQNIVFDEVDKHEPYLDHFDEQGIKVFLQVESASADMGTLIDLVLTRYKHHSSVIGFGVDVEWFGQAERRGWGLPVTDSLAEAWESRVKSYNPGYRLFLKHWEKDWMPPQYRGDILFVSDSQQFPDLTAMLDEFDTYWAEYFYPNQVLFQFGYPRDQTWWKEFNIPPKVIGDSISNRVEQQCGIFWVDFTLEDVLLTE